MLTLRHNKILVCECKQTDRKNSKFFVFSVANNSIFKIAIKKFLYIENWNFRYQTILNGVYSWFLEFWLNDLIAFSYTQHTRLAIFFSIKSFVFNYEAKSIMCIFYWKPPSTNINIRKSPLLYYFSLQTLPETFFTPHSRQGIHSPALPP